MHFAKVGSGVRAACCLPITPKAAASYTPKTSLGVRTTCLRFHQGPHHSFPCRKGQLAAPTFQRPPFIDSLLPRGRASKLHSSRSRQRTYPSPPKRQQATRTPKTSLGVRTACLRFHQGPHHSFPCRKGQLAAPTFQRPPFIDSLLPRGRASKLYSSRSRQRTYPSPPKRQQATRTPKTSLGVRTACLRFHQGPHHSFPCRKGQLAAPTFQRPPFIYSLLPRCRASKLYSSRSRQRTYPSPPKRQQAARTPEPTFEKCILPPLIFISEKQNPPRHHQNHSTRPTPHHRFIKHSLQKPRPNHPPSRHHQRQPPQLRPIRRRSQRNQPHRRIHQNKPSPHRCHLTRFSST